MWDRLKNADKPIVLYGTGNAAEKIISELNKRDISIAGIFASDGFVRSRSFAGFPVLSYDQAKQKFGDMIVLLCFGSHLSEVISNFKRIDDEQELYAPDLPVCGDDLFTREYYEAHINDIQWARSILADEQSKFVFDSVIEYKLSGKIQYLFDCESDEKQNWNLLKFSDSEDYLDLGAYTGDTVREFLDCCNNKYKSIIAVEPEPRNYRKLCEFTDSMVNCSCMNLAIGSESKTIDFAKSNGRGGAVGKGKTLSIQMETIDNIIKENNVSFIKMDLEGQEPFAIKGGQNTIKRCKPKMLIAAYHRSDDLWALPKQILSYNPEYKLYLRKDPCIPAWEINLYVI